MLCPACKAVFTDPLARAEIRAEEQLRILDLLRGMTMSIPVDVELWGGGTHTETITAPFPIAKLEALLNRK